MFCAEPAIAFKRHTGHSALSAVNVPDCSCSGMCARLALIVRWAHRHRVVKMTRTRSCIGAVVAVGPLMFVGCSNDQQTAREDTTAVTTQASAPISVTSLAQPSATTITEPNCESHRPAGFPEVVWSKETTVEDVRAIRWGTLPPQPTELLLPSYSPGDPALLCIASSDHHSYASYWVASGGEVGDVCISTYGEGAEPSEPQFGGCD